MRRVLEGKVTVVTGAASGIGRAIAGRFAEEGAKLVLVDVQANKGEEIAAELSKKHTKAIFVHADLADARSSAEIVPFAMRTFGQVNIVINNAGLFGWINNKPVEDTGLDVWEQTLNVNLRATFILSKGAIPHMIRSGGGAFVNISSIGGIQAFPEFAAYCVSKAGLILLTKSLAVDYGRHNIRANAICPGAIDTPGNDVLVTDRAEYLRTIASVTPLQKPGTPEDIAAAALFLASDDARYITGTTLIVDGGRAAVA
jgi:dihydroanticapsin dehydrogenase